MSSNYNFWHHNNGLKFTNCSLTLFQIISECLFFQVIPECLFFTDKVSPKNKYYASLEEEKKLHKDMRFQPLRGGIEFGVRFLYHMVWATSHYDFDYFVRVDDDYFFCLERFLWEVPLPMVPR